MIFIFQLSFKFTTVVGKLQDVKKIIMECKIYCKKDKSQAENQKTAF